jgi:hypothetical protein
MKLLRKVNEWQKCVFLEERKSFFSEERKKYFFFFWVSRPRLLDAECWEKLDIPPARKTDITGRFKYRSPPLYGSLFWFKATKLLLTRKKQVCTRRWTVQSVPVQLEFLASSHNLIVKAWKLVVVNPKVSLATILKQVLHFQAWLGVQAWRLVPNIQMLD